MSESTQPKEIYLTSFDLAQRWRMTIGGLRNMRNQGRGPASVRIGGRILYRLADVEAYEREREQQPDGRKGS